MSHDDFYPELAGQRLAVALQAALDRIGSKLAVEDVEEPLDIFEYAIVTGNGHLKATVSLLAEKRRFEVKLLRAEVGIATLATDRLDEVALAINSWCSSINSAEEFVKKFPTAVISPRAFAFENDMEAEWAWDGFLRTSASELHGLKKFINAAATEPKLRQLFPVMSLNRFSLSQYTAAPFSDDCPMAMAGQEGKVLVMDKDGKPVCETENVFDAVKCFVAHLPKNVGPARRGALPEADVGVE